MDARDRNRLDMMLRTREEFLALMAVLPGHFDERIRELTKVRDEASGKLGAIRSVEEANQLLADAKLEMEKVTAARDALAVNIAKTENLFKQHGDELTRREQALAAGREKLVADEADYQARQERLAEEAAGFEADAKAQTEALDARERKIAENEARIQDMLKRLESRLAELANV